MGLIETIRTAGESLLANKTRLLLTMLGVIIGVLSVVLMLSLGSAVQNFINGQLGVFGSNLITIAPDPGVPNARLTIDDYTAIADPARVSGVRRVVPAVSGQVTAVTPFASKNYEVNGTTPDNFPMRAITFTQGVSFSEQQGELRARVAVIGHDVAKTLFPGQIALGQTLLINNVAFQVVGVTGRKGSDGVGGSVDTTVYVPLSVAQEKLFPNRAAGLKSLDSITAEAVSSAASSGAIRDIANVLRKNHNLLFGQKDDFTVFDLSSIQSTVNTITNTLRAFLAATGGISLLVGGIGIMNIMLVTVTERTREIGVRKAIGADPANIRMQFLVEALVVTFTAGVIGIALAQAITLLANLYQSTIVLTLQPASVLISLGVSVLIGVVFGLYPAYRASVLAPVEALRYE
jgi:putative ABC transport system permease protein